MMKSMAELTGKELYGKKVLLRVDFNVPVEDGKILEFHRIDAVKETLDYLVSNGAVVMIVSHITVINSFEIIFGQLENCLGRSLIFIKNWTGTDLADVLTGGKYGDIFLLDNIRQYEGEEKNDAGFAKKIAGTFDIYVNDAFAVCHRGHASVSAVTNFLPSYAGFLLVREIENLSKAIKSPKENKTLILGGAKIETKFPVIKNFLDKAQAILIGGAVANVFLKAKGIEIKKSLTDDNFLEDAKNLLKEENFIIPDDYIVSNDMILDIGQKTIDKFTKTISESKMVIWNGPLGKAETPEFAFGTKQIAEAIIKSGAFSVVGGGDTIAFLEKLTLVDKFNYVSTGGGAMLEFLAGNKLPGLLALGYD